MPKNLTINRLAGGRSWAIHGRDGDFAASEVGNRACRLPNVQLRNRFNSGNRVNQSLARQAQTRAIILRV
jgi:hypothetical protein